MSDIVPYTNFLPKENNDHKSPMVNFLEDQRLFDNQVYSQLVAHKMKVIEALTQSKARMNELKSQNEIDERIHQRDLEVKNQDLEIEVQQMQLRIQEQEALLKIREKELKMQEDFINNI